MLFCCWASVVDCGPALKQQYINDIPANMRHWPRGGSRGFGGGEREGDRGVISSY